MVIRTFFDKNNTIVRNRLTNTGKNPVCELVYGGQSGSETYSRYIFHFDETRLRALYNDGSLGDLTQVKHTLRMTNTGTFDQALLGTKTCTDKQRSCSFDLYVFPVPQYWDEGVGYDYDQCGYVGYGNGNSGVFHECPSNWVYSETNTEWPIAGIFSGSASVIAIGEQHFEDGSENLNIDITDYVNGILTGDTNYGLGIAYPSTLEMLTTNDVQYVGFFTRHTQTFYEPFLETAYSGYIKDDRANFYADKLNKLYLYSNVGGVPTNLDNIPQVLINDNYGNLYTSFTQDQVTQVAKGVYCIEFIIPDFYGDCARFSDVWSGITINGVSRPNVELEFSVLGASQYYNIGDTMELPKKYGFTVSGIKHGERIKRGDIRRVNVSARIPYTTNQTQVIDRLQYRLYVKEGAAEYTVIDFQDVNITPTSNYFLIDTESLIPNTYYLDVKVESNYEVTTTKDILGFEIVNQSELRDSQ